MAGQLAATQAKALYDSGDLSEAIEEITREVKANPTDTARRAFLFECSASPASGSGPSDNSARSRPRGRRRRGSRAGLRNCLRAEQARQRLVRDGLARTSSPTRPTTSTSTSTPSTACARRRGGARASRPRRGGTPGALGRSTTSSSGLPRLRRLLRPRARTHRPRQVHWVPYDRSGASKSRRRPTARTSCGRPCRCNDRKEDEGDDADALRRFGRA